MELQSLPQVLYIDELHYLIRTERCVCVCVIGDLQLYCACGVLEQSDRLRVGHAFRRGSTDTDNAVPDLEK